MLAIEKVETGGDNNIIGASGEITSMQLMPQTFRNYSMEVLGYVAKPTKINAEYIAVKKIDGWMKAGMKVKEVSLMWNQGHTGQCSSGTNKYGVKYDSCNYVAMVTANY